jgi:hypothetical protein
LDSRNTINSILKRLETEMVPAISEQDIIETISTLYPASDHLKENNIVINETVMTTPLATSQEIKSLLQKDNSPMLEIYKELERGDVLKVLEINNSEIMVENLSIKEEYRKPFKINKIDIAKGNFNVIKRKSIDLIKALSKVMPEECSCNS